MTIAASPNCRSRSSSSVRFCRCLAKPAARLVAVTVLPVPPLGEKTVTTRPVCARVVPGVARLACDAFLIVKTTFSTSCGRSRTSATSAASAPSRISVASPAATTTIGERVC
jgi:hypothetical protein